MELSQTAAQSRARAAFSGAEALLAPALVELGLARRSLKWFRSIAGPSIGAFILFSMAFAATYLGRGPKPFHWGGLIFGSAALGASIFFGCAAKWRMSRASALASQMPEKAPALRDGQTLRSLAAGEDDDAAFLAREMIKSQNL